MKRYKPAEIEPKWQKVWAETEIYRASEKSKQPKYYQLEFFPYPSAATMHVGHVRNYTISDAQARYKRMCGFNVLHPMGWDAFGLPAENYAIKSGQNPRQSNDENIKIFKRQLGQLGFSYDWSREIDSSQPDYYQWTQWLFLRFLQAGLAYRAKSFQNWCPKDQTVLANEQVVNDSGRNVCERCGTEVVQKELDQWFLKITDYADRLIDDLDEVDWPEHIKTMQRNWIGRSDGAEIIFKAGEENIKIFTTRPDTIFGATYLVLAPEHPAVVKITTKSQRAAVDKYVQQAANKTELDRKAAEKIKSGVFTGAYAINPASGDKIPVWVADYVLMNYGSGAIMAVPAHDERDHDFAQTHKLPVVNVIEPTFGEAQGDEKHKQGVNVIVRNPKTDKVIVLDWGPRRGRWGGQMLIGGGVEPGEDIVECAKREITEETGYIDVKLVAQSDAVGHGFFYSNVKNQNYSIDAYGLYFELLSDKRTKTDLEAGEKNKFTVQWVKTSEVAPRLDDGIHRYFFETLVLNKPYGGEGILVNSGQYNGQPTSTARESIAKDLGELTKQYRLRDWTISRQRYWGCPIPVIHCGRCGIQPVPEDQLPVLLPEDVEFKPTGQSPLVNLPDFVNTECPACGGPAKRETDTFDTFVDSSWYYLRFADPRNDKSAFSPAKVDYWLPVDMYVGGAEHAVVHLLYARFWAKFLYDQKLVKFNEPFKSLRNQGMIGGADGRKMGKRFGNVVTPEELIGQGYGADALRLYELFIGPYDQGVDWNPRGIAGTYRFLDRVWVLTNEFLAGQPAASGHNAELDVELRRLSHKAVKKISQDLSDLGFNTAVAALMEFVNRLYKLKSPKNFALARQSWREALISLAQLLAPMAPHIAEELWQLLGQSGSVHASQWPAWDESLVAEALIKIAVQIDGKVRAEVMVEAEADEQSVAGQAMREERVKELLAGRQIRRQVYVPGRLINFVLG